jgi:hypothetical protein
VYLLRVDGERYLGQAKRRLHGVYLDDEERERREGIDEARGRFEALLSIAAERIEGIERAEAAAAELARRGGADRLLPLLDRGQTRLRRRVAAMGLGEAGYLAAVPYLGQLLGRHSGSPELAQQLCRLLKRLTGLTLDASEPATAGQQVLEWAKEHPPRAPYERVGR